MTEAENAEAAKQYRLSTIKLYETAVGRKVQRAEVDGVKFVESQMLIWMCEEMRAAEMKVAKCINMMTEAINESVKLREELGKEETDTLVDDKVGIVKKVFPDAMVMETVPKDEPLPFNDDEDALFKNDYPKKKGA
jgi:hypothetical protein